jgi:competence protein ComEA
MGLNRIESAATAAVVVMLTLGVWWWTSLPSEGPDSTTADHSSILSVSSTMVDRSEAPFVLVHVAGEVRKPGVVRLSEGARVVDAIEAAGGATEAAVLAGVNLAAEVRDGSQIVVPSHHAPAERVPNGDGLVAINTATASELEDLPGVGPVLAGRIVAHREEHGAFDTTEDLLDVSGIGEAILARLRPLVRVP